MMVFERTPAAGLQLRGRTLAYHAQGQINRNKVPETYRGTQKTLGMTRKQHILEQN
jgi:hypothetical protein